MSEPIQPPMVPGKWYLRRYDHALGQYVSGPFDTEEEAARDGYSRCLMGECYVAPALNAEQRRKIDEWDATSAETIFCANCDAEAVCHVAETWTPLCHTCRTAYEWGQASPDASFVDLDDEDDTDDADDEQQPDCEYEYPTV